MPLPVNSDSSPTNTESCSTANRTLTEAPGEFEQVVLTVPPVAPVIEPCDNICSATPSRKRGKCMSRRPGQCGTVVRKGQSWHGRYYADVPGEQERKSMSVPLGPKRSRTKSEAKRKLRLLLEKMGINSDAHLNRATQPVKTFAQEAEWWKKNRLSLYKPSCQVTMGSHVDKYLVPQFGALPVEMVEEKLVQEFIAQLNRTKFSPKSIRNVIGVLRLILGKKVWRDWNLTLPEIPLTEQRCFTEQEML